MSTDHRHGDGEIVPGLLAQLPKAKRIGVISGDGAYDTRGVYEASAARQADLVVPPRRNGKPWKRRTTGATERNETLRAIQRKRGLRALAALYWLTAAFVSCPAPGHKLVDAAGWASR
ncbi:Transposase (plasmid) [Roseomonas mucosa]|nr:Transposase [Roseomonas mucosa]